MAKKPIKKQSSRSLNGQPFSDGDFVLDSVLDENIVASVSTNKNKKKKTNLKDNEKLQKFKENMSTKAELSEKYFPKCTQARFWQIVALSVAGIIGVGFGYLLNFPFILVCAVATFFLSQTAIYEFCKNKYENQKINDVASYIEQMLYSFRRNSKILASLQDTITIFEDGEMKDAIQAAINHIVHASTVGNVYEEALEIIGKKYDCRRIRSLHRYLIKVEGVGGDHEIGIQALIKDRRLWLDRIDDYKKEKSAVIKEIIIASVFSSAICAITMHMLPSYVGAMEHIITRSFSTIYILINLFTITQTIKNTTFYLNDTYTIEEENYLLKKFRWLKNWDKKTEQKKGFKVAIMICGLAGFAVVLGYWPVALVFLGLAGFQYFIQPLTRRGSTNKNITGEIERAYPDWLLELSLLLQTENLHVALDKTIDTAPKLLKDDLEELSENIASYPTEVFPYTKFLKNMDVPNIHSSMKLLYSISAYGSEDEEKQISELIERNSTLMNKAEELNNQKRLAKVFIYKFIPMGASALKLIVDMAVFLIIFMSTSLSAL